MADTGFVIRPLEARDIRATAELLACAMADDPAYGYLFPPGERHATGLRDLFAGNLRTHLPYRCTSVAFAGSALVGTVTMRPPDGFSISLLTMIRRGLLPFALAHGQRVVRRLLRLKRTYDAIEARLAGGERHWLVHMMAIDPAHQGTGLGSRLLGHVLRSTVDAPASLAPAPALLTTHKKRNVVFYERVGFEVERVDAVSLPGAAAYSVWSMRRRGAASATSRRAGEQRSSRHRRGAPSRSSGSAA